MTAAARTATRTAIAEVRSAAPDLADLPDDVATWLLLRYGDGWLDVLPAYRGLASSRGVTLAQVLTAASHDRLRDIVDLEVTGAR